jgi:thioredoxin 1
MKRLVLLPTLAALALMFAGCSRGDAAVLAAPTTAARPAPMAEAPQPGARPKLVFFMNPNGRPCQIQDQILQSMAAELAGRADLVYFRTTEGGDLPRFEQFGIRSLPALVLTDANGVELRRATPGIQSDAQVRALLGR